MENITTSRSGRTLTTKRSEDYHYQSIMDTTTSEDDEQRLTSGKKRLMKLNFSQMVQQIVTVKKARSDNKEGDTASQVDAILQPGAAGVAPTTMDKGTQAEEVPEPSDKESQIRLEAMQRLERKMEKAGQLIGVVRRRMDRLRGLMDDRPRVYEDLRTEVENLKRTAKRAIASGVAMMTDDLPKERRILPEGFPIKTREEFREFIDEENNPAKQETYDELVMWLALCGGHNVITAVNEMISATITDEVCSELVWSHPKKNSISLAIKGSKYISACQAAIELKSRRKDFGDNNVITDDRLKDAVQKALSNAKERLRVSRQEREKQQGENQDEDEA